MQSKPQIKDIKSISKLLQDHKNLSAFRKAFPILRPFLKLLKVNVTKIEEAFEQFGLCESQLFELAQIPDTFNDIFSQYGWIMYEMMDFELAKKAIQLAEKEGIESAEEELTNYYTPEQVKWRLFTMHGVRAFHSRMDLADKALTDYTEGRYHACVPVVLALLDGMVNEIHGKQKGLARGFSSEKSDLEAWDSIAAHSKGLNALKGIFNTGRYTTVSDQITIPYRNGILHGMDLGYDNKIVAAKVWAALFAAREWAIKAERGLLEAQPEKPQATWKEILHDLAELNRVKKSQDEWTPVERTFERDNVITETNEFLPGSPEYALADYLLLWKKNNYGMMGELLSRFMNGKELKSFPAKIRNVYKGKKFSDFTVSRIIETSPTMGLITGTLNYHKNELLTFEECTIRVIAETPAGDMALRLTNETVWRIMDINILE